MSPQPPSSQGKSQGKKQGQADAVVADSITVLTTTPQVKQPLTLAYTIASSPLPGTYARLGWNAYQGDQLWGQDAQNAPGDSGEITFPFTGFGANFNDQAVHVVANLWWDSGPNSPTPVQEIFHTIEFDAIGV